MDRPAPKSSVSLTKAQQEEAARLFGKHISKRKGLALFVVTSIAGLLRLCPVAAPARSAQIIIFSERRSSYEIVLSEPHHHRSRL